MADDQTTAPAYTPPPGVTIDMSKSVPLPPEQSAQSDQPYTPPPGVTIDMSKSVPLPGVDQSQKAILPETRSPSVPMTTSPGAAVAAVSRFLDDQKASGGAMGALQRYTQAHANHSQILSAVVDLNEKLKKIGLNEFADALTRGISTALITGGGGISPDSIPSLPKAAPEAAPEATPVEASPSLKVNPFVSPTESRVTQEAGKFGLPEGSAAAGTRAPAQRMTIEPPTTTSTTAPPPEGRLVMTPEELASHKQIQQVAAQRASEQGMRSAAEMPRMGAVPGKKGGGAVTTTTTPGRVVPGKEFLTTYADNPGLANLPSTEQTALEDLIRPNVKAGKLYGTNVNWNKTLQDFDKLGEEGQKAKFANPKAVREGLRRSAAVESVKDTIFGHSVLGRTIRILGAEEIYRSFFGR